MKIKKIFKLIVNSKDGLSFFIDKRVAELATYLKKIISSKNFNNNFKAVHKMS